MAPKRSLKPPGSRPGKHPEQTPPPAWKVEGTSSAPQPAAKPRQSRPPHWLWIVLGLLLLNWGLASLFTTRVDRTTVPYTFFHDQVVADNVAEVTSRGDTIEGKFRRETEYVASPDETTDIDGVLSDAKVTNFTTERPTFASDDLLAELTANNVVVNAKTLKDSGSLVWTILFGFGPTLLFIGGYIWLMRRFSGGGLGGIGGIGKSKAVRYDASARRTTFADVAGIDEAKDELIEIVDFLRNPSRYQAMGARIPRGALLTGPPGTGKTLLARAVAGEAGVPFFSMSASEFIEMIVGVGASRVRDLFNQAKAAAPAIIFIDELDAIGRARGGGASFGGVDEREQTLNQILTEMDGFTGNEGVIVLAATNRPEVLDPALLRAGRFDRHVVVNPPDQAGRAAILAVHTRNVPLAADAGLDVIAATTTGMVGADLANLANEAALLAARRSHSRVALADFTDALERIVLGAERKIVISAEERRRTAYHESGHALLGMLQPGADPVRKVSIIPRGRALGVTFQSPIADRHNYNEAYLRGRIIGALGGRAAEEVVFGDATTGAESDLEQVSAIARQMVGRWGMSAEIGPMSVMPAPGAETAFLSLDPRASSDATRQMVDVAARRIVEECNATALDLLRTNRDKLDALATALLSDETLDEVDAYEAAGVFHEVGLETVQANAATPGPR